MSTVFDEFFEVVKTLRAKCPWDKEQTHASMRRFLIEEAYEAAEAIDVGHDDALREELGDILLHVCFHSIIADERGAFNIEDVIRAVSEKLVDRHPHVFGDTDVSGPVEVLKNWEAIKTAEKGEGKYLLDGIPRSLPALLRAHRIQDRVRTVGFEWEDASGVLDKICEEAEELRSVVNAGNDDAVEAELGDLLFSIVNLCRYFGVDPSTALNRTNDEFIRRFNAVEVGLAERGKSLSETGLEEMEEIWQDSK
ncbi:MAG: nucleoside triphosphate pyrophosphohydrolase [Candidatus Coatesbacteria bacterium]|nr:MAG: nucleoside triphosphate pyrophosphohydrolase [Candidatus Coatesbacteria bacterium]